MHELGALHAVLAPVVGGCVGFGLMEGRAVGCRRMFRVVLALVVGAAGWRWIRGRGSLALGWVEWGALLGAAVHRALPLG